MSLPYDLNLAIGYACTLAIFSWTAFWLVPLALRAIAAAVRQLALAAHARLRRSGPPGGMLAQQSHEHWWGPHSSSH
jgi:hypothetical protein